MHAAITRCYSPIMGPWWEARAWRQQRMLSRSWKPLPSSICCCRVGLCAASRPSRWPTSNDAIPLADGHAAYRMGKPSWLLRRAQTWQPGVTHGGEEVFDERVAQHRPRAGVSGIRVGVRSRPARSGDGCKVQRALHEPALFHRRGDEACKQGMRFEGPRLQFRVELHADEPRVVGELDDLRQQAVRRHAAKAHAHFFQARAVARIDLVAVSMTL